MFTDGEEFAGNERFSITRRIGAGGMGVVYEAFDREGETRVAIKTIRQLDPAALFRFKREFRSLAEVVHPNLLQLLELIYDADRWFFTMELVEDGVDLCTYLRGPKWSTAVIAAAPPRRPSPIIDTGIGMTEWGQSGAAPAVSISLKVSESIPNSDETAYGLAESAIGKNAGASSVDPIGDAPPLSVHPEDFDYSKVRRAFRQLADAVRALHNAGKLHRDLKPGNVLVRKDGRLLVLDFGLMSELGQPKADMPPKPGPIEAISIEDSREGEIFGTIAYMSPEQAAALSLSPASDWYAVGVMLYQAMTGQLPFTGRPWDLLHAKMDREPPPPISLVATIPADLNALCVDLLRRDPALRPGGNAVIARLAGDEAAAEAKGAWQSETFGIVTGTMPFVGRESHLAELTIALDRVLRGETILQRVHGPSGAGKSVLLEHFLAGAAAGGAVVLSGRCYEQESVPYKAVDQLIDSLTRHLLRLDKSAVEAVLPPDVGALTRVFPVLRRVEAIAAAAGATGQTDANDLRAFRSRAFVALRALLSRIGSQLPLVLCLDDLQWGDADSAALLSAVLEPPDAPRLLLIIAYRSDYADTNPCLSALAPLAQGTLLVDLLSPAETSRLALKLLGEDSPERRAQAEWVVRESGGGAFFIYELVRHLRAGGSRASVEGVDLDEVLWNRVEQLGEQERRLLEVVAVAGRPLQFRTAQRASRLTAAPLAAMAGLRRGHLIRSSGFHLDDEVEAYHDRVRETIVEHLPREVRKAHHENLAIALESTSFADAETLAKHFEEAERFAQSSRYYAKAAAQAMKVLAFGRAEVLYERSAQLAPTDLEKAAIHERLVHFYTDVARFTDAYDVGRRGTALLGVKLPPKFIPPLFLLDYLKSKALLRGRGAKSLATLPAMNNVRLESAVRMINAVAKAAYQVRPELCVAVATKSVNLCLTHGNTRDCAIGYMVYGSIFQGGVLNQHRAGHDFGQLALELVNKYANPNQKSEVNFVVGYFGTSWLRSAAEAEALWREAYRAGLDTGDLFHTGCAAAGIIMSYHMRGVPMDRVVAESNAFLDVLRQYHLTEPIAVLAAVGQFIRNLRGQTPDPASFADAKFDEEAHVRQLATFGSRHFAHFYFVLKMQSLYLRGRYAQALATAEESAGYLKDSMGMLHATEHHFYHALILASLYPTMSLMQRWSAWRALQAAHRKFRSWAHQCAKNFRHKERLLAAEIHRIGDRAAYAREAYAQAATAAAKCDCLSIQALALERAARFAAGKGDISAAAALLEEARSAYRRWGADAYADALR